MTDKSCYPSVIYWKWSDAHFDGRYLNDIDDLAARSGYTHFYITTHWCHALTSSPVIKEHVRRAADRIHSHGRKFVFELDARAEKTAFSTKLFIIPPKKRKFCSAQRGRIEKQTFGRGETAVKE